MSSYLYYGCWLLLSLAVNTASQERILIREKRQVALPDRRANRPRPGSAPQTDAKSCPFLNGANLQSLVCVGRSDDEVCTGTCWPGYHFALLFTLELTLTCSGGIWAPHESFPECKRRSPEEMNYCPNPGINAFSVRKPSTPPKPYGFPQGSTLEYSCDQGYELSGQRNLFCSTSGNWTDSPPRCVAKSTTPDVKPLVSCQYPEDISNGQVSYTPTASTRRGEYHVGTKLRYSCDDGFQIEGSDTLTCRSDGRWSTATPRCTIIDIKYCEYPGDLGNGQLVHYPPPNERMRPIQPGEKYPAGSRMGYECNEGYVVGGPSVLVCDDEGSWSDLPPKCIQVICENLGPIKNGRVQYFTPAARWRSGSGSSLDYDQQEYPEGALLQYKCDEGYKLNGPCSNTCQPSGLWSSDQPVCEQVDGFNGDYYKRDCGRPHTTSGGLYPWVVTIHLDNAGSRFICGGALLNAHTVLTAAHCLEGSGRLLLRFGKQSFNVEEDDTEVLTRKSSRIIIHPDYSNVTYENDIGLITIRRRIPYSARVRPICLPSTESTHRNLQPGHIGYFRGWDDTEKRVQANLPVVSDEKCRNEYRERRVALTRNMFCTGYINASHNVCQWASGSPLIFFNSRINRYTLEGLVSYGLRGNCSGAGKYAIFTKVFRFIPWIADETISRPFQ